MSVDHNVVQVVVKNDLCIGCGLCAAVCPSNLLKMKWDERGEHKPHAKGKSCPPKCCLCLNVCPFSGVGPNQDEIAKKIFEGQAKGRHSDVGYYVDSHVGYVLDESHRKKAASGGITTWLLKFLQENKIVSSVITATRNNTERSAENLFTFSVLGDSASILQSTGSKYYPIEISSALTEALHADDHESFAVVALPCLAYGLRKAMHAVPRIRRRLKYIIGLTCGQLCNRYYTEYLANLSGIPHQDLLTVDYRSMEGATSADSFSFSAISNSKTKGKPIKYHPDQARLWNHCYFTHRACRFCDDLFAETADISLMDAWLPSYIQDKRGTSLIVVRNTDMMAYLREGYERKECHINGIPVEDITISQKSHIVKKKRLIAARLYGAFWDGATIPSRRITPNENLYNEQREWIELQSSIMNTSKEAWAECRWNNNIKEFQRIMAPFERRAFYLSKKGIVMRVLRNPKRYLSKIIKP